MECDNEKPKCSNFYILPKIRKPGNPGRPLVSSCSCPTNVISKYLSDILKPIVRALPTFVKDTNHALNFDIINISCVKLMERTIICFRDFNLLLPHSQTRVFWPEWCVFHCTASL